MTLQKLAPAPVARYVTVQDAVERIGVAERTLRRWIEETDEKKKKFHRILRDPSGFVRLDLEEVEQIVRARGGVVPSVHQQIERLLERIKALESENVAQAKQYQEMLTQLQQVVATQTQMMTRQPPTSNDGHSLVVAEILTRLAHQHPKKVGVPAERRGFPSGTLRLVDFAQKHGCKLSELKKLYGSQEIELAVYQREALAMRNKQEWWITPTQHQAVADYYEQHQLAYTPCPQCLVLTQEEEAKVKEE